MRGELENWLYREGKDVQEFTIRNGSKHCKDQENGRDRVEFDKARNSKYGYKSCKTEAKRK
jgi:hypothetical protein